MIRIAQLKLHGYKSIEDVPSLSLGALNVLIGANGAGKSNLVSFFRLIQNMMGRRLQDFVGESGRGNSMLHYGAKRTPRIEARLTLENEAGFVGRYAFQLQHVPEDTLMIAEEGIEYSFAMTSAVEPSEMGQARTRPVGRANLETAVWGSVEAPYAREPDYPQFRESLVAVRECLGRCCVYHFHDTSPESRIRQTADRDDNLALHSDGGNLAAMLYRFRSAAAEGERVAYYRIVETFRQLAPWFGEFVLEPDPRNPEKIRLRWRDKGSEVVFGPHVLPDGALRAIALITLLLQPREMLPRLIVIDEPELGLHPFAINALAGLVAAAACHCQVILATQSVSLLEHFDPEDVVVVERQHGASTFNRLPLDDLKEWLEDYSLGELWQKNVIGGGPV